MDTDDLAFSASHHMETFSMLLLFVRGIHRSQRPVKGALMFSLICAWLNDWVNNLEAGDLRHHRVHYDVIVMEYSVSTVDTDDLVFSARLSVTSAEYVSMHFQWPLLLTWFNFNHSMDK